LIPRSRLRSAAQPRPLALGMLRGQGIEDKAVCGCACVGRRPRARVGDDLRTPSVWKSSLDELVAWW
jgi:hypothetical protein